MSTRRRDAGPTGENIDLFGEGDNVFADSVDAGHRVDPRAQKIFVLCVVLLALFAFALVVPKNMLDPNTIHEADASGNHAMYQLNLFVESFQRNVSGLVGMLVGDEAGDRAMSWTALRYVVIALAGAGLALSGAVYQGSFRNALVSPSTLGVMTGGTLGMTLWVVGMNIAFGGVSFEAPGEGADLLAYLNSSLGLALTSFSCCLLVVGLVLLVMRLAGGQNPSGIMMIITGQVVGGVLGVVGTLVRYYYVTTDPWGEVAGLLQELQVATFYREFSTIDVIAVGVPLVIVFLAVMRIRQKMMLLAFDSAEQRSMGVDTQLMRVAVVVLCTLLTAIIISFCGAVGFVGFLVPHLTRRLVGPNFKYLLPAATVLGAIFVLGAYVLVEIASEQYATMSGMFISIGGATVFLVTALRGKGAQVGTFR